MSQSIRASDGQVWTLPDFIKTPAEAAERDMMLSRRYFLVRQGSLGEIFRCKRCNGQHTYLSLMCIERPFSGVVEGLWGFLEVAGTPEAFWRLTAHERRTIEHVRRMFGGASQDLATSHPQTARALGVEERDIFRGAVPLGILDEVPASLAQRFVSRINARGLKPPLLLPGLTP